MGSGRQDAEPFTAGLCRLPLTSPAQRSLSGIPFTTPSRGCHSLSSWMWCSGDGASSFLYSPFVAQVRAPWLNRFRHLFGSLLDWWSVLLFHVEPTPGPRLTYGYSLFVILYIVRAVILRCLWIHRNDIRFNNDASYLLAFKLGFTLFCIYSYRLVLSSLGQPQPTSFQYHITATPYFAICSPSKAVLAYRIPA